MIHLVALAAAVPCVPAGPASVSIQWSTPLRSTSPNGRWSIEVRPALDKRQNSTPVFVRDCATGRARLLIGLGRRAVVTWNDDDVVIVDEPGAGDADLALMRLHRGRSGPVMSKDPRAAVSIAHLAAAQLHAGEKIAFEFIKVTARPNSLLGVVVSGVATPVGGGENRPFCVAGRYRIDTGRMDGLRRVTTNADTLSPNCTYFP